MDPKAKYVSENCFKKKKKMEIKNRLRDQWIKQKMMYFEKQYGFYLLQWLHIMFFCALRKAHNTL